MKKSGCLRRVVLLAIIGWLYYQFVILDSPFNWSPETKRFMTMFLWAVIGWGVFTLFADRAGGNSKDNDKEDS